MLDPIHVCELLSVLVPLVAERAAYDVLDPAGDRRRLATFDQRRGASTEDGAPPSGPVSSHVVHVRVDDVTVGELVVWRHGSLSVVEEALVVLTAERLADETEIATLRRRSLGASALADGLGLDLRGPLQAFRFGLELLRARMSNGEKPPSRDWLVERIEGLERAAARIEKVADRLSEVSRPAAEMRNAASLRGEHHASF